MRLILGFELAFAIGAVCRLARIPSPAPNALLGSLLVVAMSVGYIGATPPPANSFFS
jgi:XapX domain-containing protein